MTLKNSVIKPDTGRSDLPALPTGRQAAGRLIAKTRIEIQDS
jgi:hypothetical protein